MKPDRPTFAAPPDAARRRAARPVIAYPPEALARPDMAFYQRARSGARKLGEVLVAPRQGQVFEVPAGHFFRITCVEGPQVGDLNLWARDNPGEHFYSGKTRAFHGTHLSKGDRLWSNFPWLRPMATIVADSLDWYGFDADGASVHDVIGTRCDPYAHFLASGENYHHCCHSNLTRALAQALDRPMAEVEAAVHDVLNVFMLTGFSRQTGQYFMKASPVRPGDYLEFFAEIALLGGLSACPGGDCSASHSSDGASCHPLLVEIFAPAPGALADWAPPPPNGYDRSHGL